MAEVLKDSPTTTTSPVKLVSANQAASPVKSPSAAAATSEHERNGTHVDDKVQPIPQNPEMSADVNDTPSPIAPSSTSPVVQNERIPEAGDSQGKTTPIVAPTHPVEGKTNEKAASDIAENETVSQKQPPSDDVSPTTMPTPAPVSEDRATDGAAQKPPVSDSVSGPQPAEEEASKKDLESEQADGNEAKETGSPKKQKDKKGARGRPKSKPTAGEVVTTTTPKPKKVKEPAKGDAPTGSSAEPMDTEPSEPKTR